MSDFNNKNIQLQILEDFKNIPGMNIVELAASCENGFFNWLTNG